MFEFFIALFGGAYYISRLAGEKHESKKIDRQIQEHTSNLQRDDERWVNRVVDMKLEYELSNISIGEKEKMKQRILNEAGVANTSDSMILMGLLAQKAKIPKDIATSGIRSYGVWDYVEQQKWNEQRRFMIWYDKELRKNGLQEPMLFVDGVNERKVRYDMSVASPVTNTSRVIGGRYFWAPMRVHVLG